MKEGPQRESPKYPTWFYWSRIGIPLAAALTTGLWVALTLTGTIPAIGMMQWAPYLFSSLDGLAALTAVSLAFGAVSSLTWLIATTVTKALTSYVPEGLVIQQELIINDQNVKLLEQQKLIEELNKPANDDVNPTTGNVVTLHRQPSRILRQPQPKEPNDLNRNNNNNNSNITVPVPEENLTGPRNN